MELSLPFWNTILASRTTHPVGYPPTLPGDPSASSTSSYQFLYPLPSLLWQHSLSHCCPTPHASSCLLMVPTIPPLGPDLRARPCMQTLRRCQQLYLETVSQIWSLPTTSIITTLVQATFTPHLGCCNNLLNDFPTFSLALLQSILLITKGNSRT